jgi:8-oxo-dGTP diphosphatase
MKITVGTVCFILNKDNNKILLLKRAFEPMQNMVTGVGGKTHFNEDIKASCIREVKEETGFDVTDLKLHGVIKTLLNGYDSSWILSVYSTNNYSGNLIDCPEGELTWVDIDAVYDENLIGFIRDIMPAVLENRVIEGTIEHDIKGNVINKVLTNVQCNSVVTQ